ncbi:MAG: response regulator [Planctomycetota bacterium]
MAAIRVLVVEDEAPIRRILSDALAKHEGYEVASAEDGQTALEFLKARDFDWDLVITDLMMPRMSGTELIHALRTDAPHIGCLVLTAYKNDTNVISCLKNGAYDYVLKPVELKQLFQVLRRAVDRHKRFSEPPDALEVTSEVRGWVELTAPSDYEYVERFRKFSHVLGNVPLSAAEREDICMIMDELGQNAVEWGNRGDSSKKIRLSYCIFDDRIVFKIEDEGAGFDPDALRDPSQNPIEHLMLRMQEGKRAGGYGVFLSRKLMDETTYSDAGNAVLLTKYFKARPDTTPPTNPSPPSAE